ncbi:MAG: GtrA family protein [Hamadaea sp.]|uniref:GtrA family protein n=1 Tax=Hamadaea sp. TaxID=2024425 RepID=UPI0017F6852D|nr:GtrA family protein [Hamadaea sp.]NUR72262.1 GtrA family protein [Hamadaea sp.]NUT23218.1 GtrA family protein [Hamadaea sp.]
MRLVRFLPERFHQLAHEALKFGLVGVLNTLINLAVFNALLVGIHDVGRVKANVVATVVATVFAYMMSRYWTFRDRPSDHSTSREFVLFVIFNLIGLGIESALIGTTVYILGTNSILAVNIAKVLGLGIGTVFRFWAYRTFVFRGTPATSESEALAAAAATTGTLGVEATLEEIEAAYSDGLLTEEQFTELTAAQR